MMNDTHVRTEKTRGFPLVTLSAVLLLGTTPHFDVPLISLLAFVPFLYLIHTGISRRHRFWWGLVLGTVYGIAVLIPFFFIEGWWFTATPLLLALKPYLWALAIALGAVVFYGLQFAIFFAFYTPLRRRMLLHVFCFTLLWFVLEYISGLITFNSSWGQLGLTLHDNALLVQTATLGGIYGASALVISMNILIAFTCTRFFENKNEDMSDNTTTRSSSTIRPLLMLIVLLLSSLAYGHVVQNKHTEDKESGEKLSVAVLHTRLERTTDSDALFAQYHTLLEQAAADADVVVAPESIFHPIEIDRATYRSVGYHEPQLSIHERYDALIKIFETHPDTTFVLGLKTRHHDERYSSIVVFEDGVITDIYDKRVPLPFAEQSESLHMDRVVPAIDAGPTEQSINIKGYAVNASICSEIVYPRLYERDRAFTITVSNEEVFPSSALKKQNHIMAKFRAVEHRQYLLRATKDGYSSIIAPTGEVLAASNEDETQILRATIYVE